MAARKGGRGFANASTVSRKKSLLADVNALDLRDGVEPEPAEADAPPALLDAGPRQGGVEVVAPAPLLSSAKTVEVFRVETDRLRKTVPAWMSGMSRSNAASSFVQTDAVRP